MLSFRKKEDNFKVLKVDDSKKSIENFYEGNKSEELTYSDFLRRRSSRDRQVWSYPYVKYSPLEEDEEKSEIFFERTIVDESKRSIESFYDEKKNEDSLSSYTDDLRRCSSRDKQVWSYPYIKYSPLVDDVEKNKCLIKK